MRKSMSSQREIFKKTLEWVQERIDKGILNSTSGDLLEEAQGMLRNEIAEYFKKQDKALMVTQKLKKAYSDFYTKDGFKESNNGISKAKISNLREDFKKELKKKIITSFNLIKNNDDAIKQKLASRFLNWLTIDSEEVRGATASKQSLLNFLDFAKENEIAENHAKFIIADQTRKMIASFDDLIAKENGAIGAIWHNRGDRRVVGNPDGLYPTGNDAHGDHWDREGVFYVFKDGWAYKNGLIKGEIYENLEDGGVGVAIGCRCRLENIFDLRDVPIANLTKKGKEIVNA